MKRFIFGDLEMSPFWRLEICVFLFLEIALFIFGDEEIAHLIFGDEFSNYSVVKNVCLFLEINN